MTGILDSTSAPVRTGPAAVPPRPVHPTPAPPAPRAWKDLPMMHPFEFCFTEERLIPFTNVEFCFPKVRQVTPLDRAPTPRPQPLPAHYPSAEGPRRGR